MDFHMNRQHLGRTHEKIPQCFRCWEVFSDQMALADHTRHEEQCPIMPQQAMEGLTQHKWDLIKSKWGATWSDIYEIIFPGAPVPSPCTITSYPCFDIRTR